MKLKLATANRSICTLVVAVVLAGIMTPGITMAQAGGRVSPQGSTTQQGSGDSFRIAPLRTDITARPGETKKVTVYLENLTDNTKVLKPIDNDFIAGSKEDGTPSLILNDNEYAPTHSLKRFMAPLSNVTVGAGERKTIEVTINVPADAQSGGYYGAIRFAPALADGSSSVNVSGSVASLILLTVPGNLIENLTLAQFTVEQNGKPSGRFSTPDHINVLLKLQNKGNIQVAPFGSIFVQKGKKIISSSKINDIQPAGLVLPDSTRRWSIPVKDLSSFGKYKIVGAVGYGGNGQTINFEKEIWVIPTYYIIGAIVAIIGIIVVISLMVTALRSYKRRILRSARRRRY